MISRLAPILLLLLFVGPGAVGAAPPAAKAVSTTSWDQGRSVYERQIRPAETPEKVDWDARVAALLHEEPGDVIVTAGGGL